VRNLVGLDHMSATAGKHFSYDGFAARHSASEPHLQQFTRSMPPTRRIR
jgi:hypothetical protein